MIRLRDRAKEIFVEFINEIFKPDGFMIRNMKKCLPREMFEGLEQFIRSTIDNIERKLAGSAEDQGDVIENQKKVGLHCNKYSLFIWHGSS